MRAWRPLASVALAAIALLLLQGCVNLPDALREQLRCAPPDNYGNAACESRNVTEWRGLRLRDGQVIVIEDDEALSFALNLLASEYRPYVHAGLIVLEDGQPFVYEAWAIYKPRLSGRPTRNPGGGVRRVTLDSFLRRPGIIAIHEPPPGADGAAAADYARASLAARTPFDEFFDAGDAASVYCAEFVARAWEAGGAAPADGIAVSGNPSVRMLLEWFEVRAPRLVLAGELLRGNRIALIDRQRNLAQIERHFARRRELHRRFTGDQRLGNVFRWSGMSLAFRPQVAAYLSAAPDAGEAVLADRLLGPVGAGESTLTVARKPAR